MLFSPAITEIITDTCKRDARLVSLLSQTCKTYRDSFLTTYEMHDLQDWLIWQEPLRKSSIKYGGHEIFDWAKISYAGQARTWRIAAECGQRASRKFQTSGVIHVGKCSAKMIIYGESRLNSYKDSFYGIQDLQTLKTCLATHTILCHELPENLPRLPETVVHRHRDTIPWTFPRAFYVWRASRPGYETWNWSRHRDQDVVDMAHRVVYFA